MIPPGGGPQVLPHQRKGTHTWVLPPQTMFTAQRRGAHHIITEAQNPKGGWSWLLKGFLFICSLLPLQVTHNLNNFAIVPAHMFFLKEDRSE